MTNNMKILIDQVTTAINSEFGDDLPTLEQINEKADTFRVLFAQLYPISDEEYIRVKRELATNDLRSSNMLEIVASEFKVQGLEIDWAIVCWDADLRRNHSGTGWDYYSFRGTKWMHRNKVEQQRYLVNSYRVLLTRARQGMILFVPKGVDSEDDSTRDSSYYDEIYKYLTSCGINEID